MIDGEEIGLPDTVYRLVRSPDEKDYLSNNEEIRLGIKPAPKRPMSVEDQRLSDGVSVLDTPQRARQFSNAMPRLPKWIATVDVSRLPATVSHEPIDEGHFNLYGEPDTLAGAEIGERIHITDVKL